MARVIRSVLCTLPPMHLPKELIFLFGPGPRPPPLACGPVQTEAQVPFLLYVCVWVEWGSPTAGPGVAGSTLRPPRCSLPWWASVLPGSWPTLS